MTTMTSTYEIRAIDRDVVAELLEIDDAGRGPRIATDRNGGSPMRCCLRHSRPGEVTALVSYAPLRRWAREMGVDPGPYDEVGPVFIHPQPCDGDTNDGIPSEFFPSSRVFRAYGENGVIRSGRLVRAGDEPERVLDEMFADPDVALVHVRAVEFGCFTFEVRRVRAGQQP